MTRVAGYEYYTVNSLSEFPKVNLTTYDPAQYSAEFWFKIMRYIDIFDAHGSGYEENKWYKYPENPVVGTNWVGSIKYPENNNPPNWNQSFTSWNLLYSGFFLTSSTVYLYPK